MFDQTRGQHIDRPGGYIKNTGGPLLFSTGWAKKKWQEPTANPREKSWFLFCF